MKLIVTGAMLMGLFLASCTTPNEVAKKMVVSRIAEESNGYFELANYIETDAVKQNIAGVDYFNVKYTAEVRVLKGNGWITSREGYLDNFRAYDEKCSDVQHNDVNWGVHTRNECRNATPNIGDIYKYSSHLNLAKHEQGWVDENSLPH